MVTLDKERELTGEGYAALEKIDMDLMVNVALEIVQRINYLQQWQEASLMYVELPENLLGHDKLSYLRIVTNSRPGGAVRRRFVSELRGEALQVLRKRIPLGSFREAPDRWKLVKPDWDAVTTSLWVKGEGGKNILLLLPSVDSLNTRDFLKQQKKAGRIVAEDK